MDLFTWVNKSDYDGREFDQQEVVLTVRVRIASGVKTVVRQDTRLLGEDNNCQLFVIWPQGCEAGELL